MADLLYDIYIAGISDGYDCRKPDPDYQNCDTYKRGYSEGVAQALIEALAKPEKYCTYTPPTPEENDEF